MVRRIDCGSALSGCPLSDTSSNGFRHPSSRFTSSPDIGRSISKSYSVGYGAWLTSQTSRYNLMSTLALLLVVLIPFNAPVLAVWGRNIWADWRNPFPGDWDIIRISPLLTLVWLCVSGRAVKPRPR
jgi:hypothetical protein